MMWINSRGRETKNFDVAQVRKYKQIRCFETMHIVAHVIFFHDWSTVRIMDVHSKDIEKKFSR